MTGPHRNDPHGAVPADGETSSPTAPIATGALGKPNELDGPVEPAAVDDSADDVIDPLLEGLLAQLWEAANETSGKTWSLAKLSKRSQLPQSTLRRYLNSLTDAGLVTVTLDEAGLGSATLTALGRSACADLFEAGSATRADPAPGPSV